MSTGSGASLWRQSDFMYLWAAQAISQIGSQISFVALPLVAALSLNASPVEMGMLTAAGFLPSLLVSLHAGVLVDRHRRRPILVSGDLGRVILLGVVPLAWAIDLLSMELLYIVTLCAGVLTVFFDLAYQAFLPAVVARDRLVDGNAKLELSRTAAEIGGPPLAGGLIHLLTAPFAIALDAFSYLLSASFLSRIRVDESPPARSSDAPRVMVELVEGLAVIGQDARLRAVVGSRGILGFFNAMLEAVFVLYITRPLGLGPGAIGVIFGIGSVGFLVGALLPERASRRFGLGAVTAGAVALVGLSDLLVPIVSGSRIVVVLMLIVAQFSFGLGLTIFNVNQASLRQAVVPLHLQGRASATSRFLASALAPLGALLGGVLGETIGSRETLILAALGELLAAAWIWRSPLRTMRYLPPAPDDDAARLPI